MCFSNIFSAFPTFSDLWSVFDNLERQSIFASECKTEQGPWMKRGMINSMEEQQWSICHHHDYDHDSWRWSSPWEQWSWLMLVMVISIEMLISDDWDQRSEQWWRPHNKEWQGVLRWCLHLTEGDEEDSKRLIEGVKHVDPKTVRPEFFIIIINSNQMRRPIVIMIVRTTWHDKLKCVHFLDVWSRT